MPGRMGGDQVTVKNLEIVEVDLENNVLLIKGAVPGCEGGLLIIKGKGDLIIKDKSIKIEPEEKEIKEDNIEEKTEVVKEEIIVSEPEVKTEIEEKN